MLKYIDNFLNRITMYRLMLNFLFILLGLAFVVAFFGVLPFGPWDLLFSFMVLLIASWAANNILAFLTKIPANLESVYITAMILACLITPPAGIHNYVASLTVLLAAVVFSQASKYILAIRGRHIFNPAAIGIVLTGLVFGGFASWWAGNLYLLVPILIGGLLIARKIQRFDLILSFLVTTLITTVWVSGIQTAPILLKALLLYSPMWFFALVMLTEPLTTPATRNIRIIYGIVIGILFSIPFSFGPIYSSPEVALVIGNLLGFLINPQGKLRLKLIKKNEIARGVYEFIFTSNRKVSFRSGQYLEWTLPAGKNPDKRGNRRFFTIASSPTESEIHLGVKFYPNPSTFKQTLNSLAVGESILASHVAGDFTLPRNTQQKIAFIAGGIGITPFRSMAKYMVDKNLKYDCVLLYSNKTTEEAVFEDTFNTAKAQIGLKTIYAVTDQAPITVESFAKSMPDFAERQFFISGPRGFVEFIEKILKELGVARSNIKTDFFPGYV